MAHNLFRLSQKLYNRPHLIVPEAFRVVSDYLMKRNAAGFQLDSGYQDDGTPVDDDDNDPSLIDSSIGLLCVDGSLTYKPVSTTCGDVGTSYQALVAQTQALADAGVNTIVMEVSSGGGEASHCFELAAQIRSICDASGIQLIGYADEMACSAAYALICVCDVVIANPSAELGSIGVLIALMDTSKMLEQEGLKPIFISAGDNKIPYQADGSFKQSFLDGLQADVDRLNLEFVAHVSNYTGLSAETVIGFQANTYDAQTAVQLGLADAVMTSQEFAAYVAQANKGNT